MVSSDPCSQPHLMGQDLVVDVVVVCGLQNNSFRKRVQKLADQ